MNSYYDNWTEDALRNAIWQLANNMQCIGPYADIEAIREELRRRGISDRGYHNT